MANRLTELITSQANKYKDREVFSHKDYASNSWIPTNWNQLEESVNKISYALEIIGIKEQENIAIFSQNRPEIIITDFAAFKNRAVPVPIYATSSREQVNYITNDASINTIFVGDQAQYNIAREVVSESRVLRLIIAYDNSINLDSEDTSTLTFEALESLGEKSSELTRQAVATRTNNGTSDDLACLIYTSGTTGEPKGVMLTHSNFDATIEMHLERLTTVTEDDISMCFLPLSHIFERAWTYFCLTKGIKVAINVQPRDIQDTIQEIKPSIMCSVPRFWEKVYTAVQEKIATMSPIQRKIVKVALSVGRTRNLKYKRKGLPIPKWVELQYNFFDKLIFTTLRKAIGVQNGNIFPTAGAPLSNNITEFLHTCGINIVIGYGLSETTATVSCFPNEDFVIGTTGTILPRLQVKIGKDNEILVKGPTIMKGYYNKPEETAKAFSPDGFFHTGDAGKIDSHGNIILTERIKDLFKTSNGKYIAPQALESRLGEDKYIEQVAIIGDQRKYVTAIIIPAYEVLKDYANKKKIQYRNVDELVKNSEIYKLIEERINILQGNLAAFEQIKKFTILPRPFTMETGELTNTLKIRRTIINQLYRNEIEAMYA